MGASGWRAESQSSLEAIWTSQALAVLDPWNRTNMSLLNARILCLKRASWPVGLAVGVFSLLIVSAVQAANRDDVAAGAHSIEIYRCDFGAAADSNFDFWPDGWTRLRGPG